MKKRLTTLLTMMAAISASAQICLWKDGQVIYYNNDIVPDYITFETYTPEGETDKFEANRMSESVFSVSATKKVNFSLGNLQYCDQTYEWRFAPHQYDVIGLGNKNIGESYGGWIDLFGWGTSGWMEKGYEDEDVVYLLPTETSTDYRDYIMKDIDNEKEDDWKNGLTGNYVGGDWGFNEFTNAPVAKDGSDGYWRTPSRDEWNYLLTGRANAKKLFGLGTIADVKGLIILPDTWTTPEGLTFVASAEKRLKLNSNGYYEDEEMTEDNYGDNVYDAAQWRKMENAGAVFLPAAGRREGKNILNYGNGKPWGWYWSTTPCNELREGNCHGLQFYMSGVTPQQEQSRIRGASVRLVKEIVYKKE